MDSDWISLPDRLRHRLVVDPEIGDPGIRGAVAILVFDHAPPHFDAPDDLGANQGPRDVFWSFEGVDPARVPPTGDLGAIEALCFEDRRRPGIPDTFQMCSVPGPRSQPIT